jgi:D-glycero-D-manno-heptose 1,7-bisphosphate phosphatase
VTRPAAAFLDRDGVLNVDTGYAHRPEALELIEGAAEAVRRLNEAGYLVVIVTNQSGIARGLYTLADMDAFHDQLRVELGRSGATLDAIYAAPFHPDGIVDEFRQDHMDRKPRPGMILRAFDDLDLDVARSFLIGDQPTDVEAAEAAGIPGYRFDGPNLDDFVVAVLAAEALRTGVPTGRNDDAPQL